MTLSAPQSLSSLVDRALSPTSRPSEVLFRGLLSSPSAVSTPSSSGHLDFRLLIDLIPTPYAYARAHQLHTLLGQCLPPDTTPDATGILHTPLPPSRTMLCRETKRPRRPGLRVFQIHPRTLGSSRGLAVRDNPNGSHRPNNGLGHPTSATSPTTTTTTRVRRRSTAFIGTPPMFYRSDSLELVSKPLPPHVRPETMGCFQTSSRPPQRHV